MNVKPRFIALFVLAGFVISPIVWAADSNDSAKPSDKAPDKAPKRAADSARVDGIFIIPKDHADLQGMTLKVILFEYNPFLADAGADKLAELDIPNVVHKKGKATTLKFTIAKDKKIRQDRKYYLSVRGYRGKEYVYYGTPAQGGIGKVLGTDPVNVTYTGKRMKP